MFGRRLRVFAALLLREMTTRYGRSAGGYIWAVVEPMAYIIMFSLVFSQIARDPAMGRSFPLFFATGIIAFNFYRDTADVTGGAFQFNKPLFNYPHVSVLDAILARFTLQMITTTFVGCAIFSGIFIIEGMRPNIDIEPILLAIGFSAALGLAVGTLNCPLFVLSPTWIRFYGLLNRPLLLVSAIFYTPEMLPPPVREVLLFNPLVHIIGLMRRGFYPSYEADYVSFPMLIGLPLVILAVGLMVLRKNEGRLLEQ